MVIEVVMKQKSKSSLNIDYLYPEDKSSKMVVIACHAQHNN